MGKLGPVLARKSSAIPAVPPETAGRCAGRCAGSPPGLTRGSQETDHDGGHRVSRVRREQPRAQARAPRSIRCMARSSGPCSTRPRRSAATCSEDRSTWRPGSRRVSRPRSTTFVEDIGTIVAMELAQVRLLEEVLRRSGSRGAAQLRPQHRRAVGPGAGRRLRDGAAPADPAVAWPTTAQLTADTTMGILSSPSGSSRSRMSSTSAPRSAAGDTGWSGRRRISRRTRCCSWDRATPWTCSRRR